jgi:hypothetical protein
MERVMATAKVFDFGELRSLLQQPVSFMGWAELCKLVFPAKWEKASEQWLPYAQDALDRGWPDHLRELPKEWIGRKSVAAAALCRHVRVRYPTMRHIEQYTEFLERERPPITQLTLDSVNNIDAARGARLWEVLDSLESVDKLMVMHGDLRGTCDALVGGSIPARLRELRLWFNPLSAAEALALVGATSAATLRILEIKHMEDGAAGLGEVIVGAGLCEVLESLTIMTARLEAADVTALGRRRWPALRKLDLQDSAAGFAHELGDWIEAAPALKALNLTLDEVGDALAERLIALKGVELEELSLGFAVMSPEVTARLLASPLCARLKALSLPGVALDADAAAAIAGSTMAQTLEVLEVRHMQATPAFWERLGQVELPALRAIRMGSSHLSEPIAAAMAALRVPALDEIELEHVRIESPAVSALEGASWRGGLKFLGLYRPPYASEADTKRLHALKPEHH